AVIVPAPSAFGSMLAATVPKPVKVALLPIARPAASLSVPPLMTILPLVTLSALAMVRLPPLPTSRVWLLLLMSIAPTEAILLNLRVAGDVVLMVKAWPLAPAPDRVRLPPDGVTEPVPGARFAATVPKPVKDALLPIVSPAESLRVPP